MKSNGNQWNLMNNLWILISMKLHDKSANFDDKFMKIYENQWISMKINDKCMKCNEKSMTINAINENSMTIHRIKRWHSLPLLSDSNLLYKLARSYIHIYVHTNPFNLGAEKVAHEKFFANATKILGWAGVGSWRGFLDIVVCMRCRWKQWRPPISHASRCLFVIVPLSFSLSLSVSLSISLSLSLYSISYFSTTTASPSVSAWT